MKEHHLQLNLAKTELLVFPATPTLQHDFYHPVRFINNYPIKFGQKSWCNLWWPADFQRPHCKNCSILQVCIAQHQKDQAWLPVAARIKFKTLMLAYRTATGSAPSYFRSLMRIYIPSRSLRSVFIHRSWLVEWTSHPYPECWIPDNFQATPENSSLPSSLDFILKKNKKLCFLFLTSPCLATIYSGQCLKLCITSTSCVYLPLYNETLIVFLNCKSLWIKASAKWINVNVMTKWLEKSCICHQREVCHFHLKVQLWHFD